MASNNVDKATALLRGVSSGNADLVTKHVSPDGFVQHDPFVADGVAGLREQAGRSTNSSLEIVRVLEDGPLVVVHGRSGTGNGDEVFFAVFRFENGPLTEQWRFASPAAPPNESGHTQTDAPTEPDDRQDTDRAKAVVRNYFETVHIGGKHDLIGQYIGRSSDPSRTRRTGRGRGFRAGPRRADPVEDHRRSCAARGPGRPRLHRCKGNARE